MISPEYLARSGSEHGEQCAVFCWAALNRQQFPLLKWMFAIPNGGGRTAAQGAQLKAEGVKKGVSDILLPVRSREYAGLFIEMKRTKGVPSDLKTEQADFLIFVRTQGYYSRVAYGWLDAVAIIAWYLDTSKFAEPEPYTAYQDIP